MGEGTLDCGSMLGSRRPERGELLAGEALKGKLKGTVSRDGYFFLKAYKIKSVLS